MRTRAALNSDSGSIAPLGIGLAILCLSALLTVTASTSMFLFQRRLQSVADEVAIEVGRLSLASERAANQNELETLSIASLDLLASTARVSGVVIQDGQTLELKLCDDWSSPVGNPFGQAQREVCAWSRARMLD